MAQTRQPSRLLNIFLQIFALVVCFGVPALVTALSPVSWITFQRHGDHISAQAKTCLLFIIPFKTITVDPVLSLDDRTKTGGVHKERRSGRDHQVNLESEGFLILHGPEQEAEVSVTPHNLEAVVQKSQAFLADSQASELKLFVVSNWKFGVFCGGLATLLPVFILGTYGYLLVRILLRRLGLISVKGNRRP